MQSINAPTFRTFARFAVAAICYLMLKTILSFVQHKAELRFPSF